MHDLICYILYYSAKGSLTPNEEGMAGSVLMQFIDSKMYSVKLPYLVSREWIGPCSMGLVKSKGGDVCGESVGNKRESPGLGSA